MTVRAHEEGHAGSTSGDERRGCDASLAGLAGRGAGAAAPPLARRCPRVPRPAARSWGNAPSARPERSSRGRSPRCSRSPFLGGPHGPGSSRSARPGSAPRTRHLAMLTLVAEIVTPQARMTGHALYGLTGFGLGGALGAAHSRASSSTGSERPPLSASGRRSRPSRSPTRSRSGGGSPDRRDTMHALVWSGDSARRRYSIRVRVRGMLRRGRPPSRRHVTCPMIMPPTRPTYGGPPTSGGSGCVLPVRRHRRAAPTRGRLNQEALNINTPRGNGEIDIDIGSAVMISPDNGPRWSGHPRPWQSPSPRRNSA